MDLKKERLRRIALLEQINKDLARTKEVNKFDKKKTELLPAKKEKKYEKFRKAGSSALSKGSSSKQDKDKDDDDDSSSDHDVDGPGTDDDGGCDNGGFSSPENLFRGAITKGQSDLSKHSGGDGEQSGVW